MAFKDKIRKIAYEVASDIALQIANQKLQQVQSISDTSMGQVLSVNRNVLTVQKTDGTQSQVVMINNRPIGNKSIVLLPTDGIAL